MSQQRLTQDQMVSVLKAGGWEDSLIPWALTVTKRESGWSPGILNDSPSTGDLSYGLFQINMLDTPGYKLGAQRRATWGIQNDDLRDPVVNARIARDLLDTQGPNAWSVTHGGDIPFPGKPGTYVPPKSFNSRMGLTSVSTPSAAWGATNQLDGGEMPLDPLAASAVASLRRNLPDSDESLRTAASPPIVAAIKTIFGQPEQQVVSQNQALVAPVSSEISSGKFSSPVEYLTGDTSHGGYRDDHGGANYHEHLAYSTTEQARAAAALLNQHGIQTTELKGINPVGRHAPNSYHLYGQAFDVPASQVPVGQEQELSRRVRNILGMN